MANPSALDDYLANLPDDTAKELTVESAKGYYYHISTNPDIPVFTPRVCERSQKGEDRSIPRVCVADNLMDCMLGYIDIFSNVFKTCNKEGEYCGGWKIYAFDTPYVIKPSKKLLPDVALTNERWLVGYSPETKEYQPMDAGVLFVKEMRIVPNRGTRPKGSILFYLQCFLDSGMKLDQNFGDPDSEGFYQFEIPLDRFVLDSEDSLPEVTASKRNIFNFSSIDKNSFYAAKRKQTTAALASFSEYPAFSKWK